MGDVPRHAIAELESLARLSTDALIDFAEALAASAPGRKIVDQWTIVLADRLRECRSEEGMKAFKGLVDRIVAVAGAPVRAAGDSSSPDQMKIAESRRRPRGAVRKLALGGKD